MRTTLQVLHLLNEDGSKRKRKLDKKSKTIKGAKNRPKKAILSVSYKSTKN